MAALLGLIAASPARAQTSPARPATPAIDNRIPLAALDLRGVFAFLGKDPITATGLFLAAENLPSKAFGLSGGAHVYPVRGRAWAIHDGILSVLDTRWNDLRMVKQVGRHAHVNTFPDGIY